MVTTTLLKKSYTATLCMMMTTLMGVSKCSMAICLMMRARACKRHYVCGENHRDIDHQ
ncbi:MAG: hypothetical protein IIW00_00730 [Alistipes sp.]|nr:hypothetical protein [Alistipes sp.]